VLIRLNDCFAELGGFALIDPIRLAEFYASRSPSRDLLERFISSDEGELAAKEGIVIPMLGIAPGYYRIVLRDNDEGSSITAPRVKSEGWILHSLTGSLLFCGLGYLSDWNPNDPAHRKVSIPPGYYEVTIQGAPQPAAAGDEEGVYELILNRVASKPAFSASTSIELSLFD
jgi:hypothetical protein